MKREAKKLAKTDFFPVAAMRSGALCLTLAFLLPLLLVQPRADVSPAPKEAAAVTREEPAEDSTPIVKDDETAAPETLTVCIDGENRTMTMSDYLWGVLAAEMPAAFEQEALKAQAIAARTYALYRMEHRGKSHPTADICGDPGCCQAWMSKEERMTLWGKKNAKAYAKKITRAVADTEGQVLTYGGEVVYAAFHASSPGCTKSALEVWGEDIPYLQGVKSPEDTGSIPNYYSTVTVSAEQFRETVHSALPEADLTSENCADWVGKLRYDDLGLPTAVRIGGVWVDTGKVRSWFELRSASFTLEASENALTFYVTGYGHAVGMSQYGANAMANEGKTAEEILKWYYKDVELSDSR